MNWFFIALLAPALWSITNYIDKFLVSKYFKGGGTGALIIFSALIGVFVAPIFLIISPGILNIATRDALILIVSGAIYIVGLLPYLYAMSKDDVSIVVPLFQLIPVFGYVLGFVFLKEQLTNTQLLGGVMVFIGAIGISLDVPRLVEKQFKIKWDVLGLMVLSSFLVALYSFLFKFASIENESFVVSSFWQYVGFILVAIIILVFVKSYRTEFVAIVKRNKLPILGLNASNEIINIIAKIALDYASLLAPLALVWVVNGFQPLFVFVYGILITLLFPKILKENLSKEVLIQKIVFIAVIIAGSVILNLG